MDAWIVRAFMRSVAAIVCATALFACGNDRERSLALARSEVAAGKTSAAIVRLRGVLQTEPGFGEARLLLGQVLLDSGDAQTAEKELRHAAEAGIDRETVLPLRARALLESGEPLAVLSDIRLEEIRSPEARADVLVSRAYAHLLQADAAAAEQAVKQALAASPDHLRASIALALIQSASGDLETATVGIDKALSRDPKSVEALRAKASIAQGRGDWPSALQAVQALARLRPHDLAAQYTAVMLLWRSGSIDDARAQLASMKAAAPGQPLTAQLEALLAYLDKDYGAAREHVARALKGDPEFGPALLLSGLVHTQLGNFELAEHQLRKVYGRNPNNMAAQQALLRLLLRTQRTNEALKIAQDMVARAPGEPLVLLAAAGVHLAAGDSKAAQSLAEKAAALSAGDSRALRSVAITRLATGNANEAVGALMEASGADPSGIEADAMLVGYFVRQKQFDKAIEVVAVIARKRPRDARILMLEGEVLALAGRASEARRPLEAARELRPDIVAPLRLLARLDREEGKPDQAKKRFDAAIASRPKDPALRLAYAEWLHETNGDPDAIHAALAKAVEIAPKHVGARLSLVSFHASRGKLDAAITAAQQATVAVPGSERLLTTLADLQARAGQNHAAIDALTQAIQVAPASPELLVRLADLQLASGATHAARDSLSKALKLQPEYRPATIRLLALEPPGGRHAQVVEGARALQQAQPADPVGYFLEGKSWVQERKWAEAIRVLRLGIERTGAPQLVVALHSALVKAGRPDEAAKTAADWLKGQPNDILLRTYLADTALAAKDYPAAIRLYKDVVQAYPNNARALNNLAWAAGKAGDPMAIEFAERASRIAPDDPNVLDTLGWLLVERGDHARGTELLRRASKAAPGAPNIRLNLAKALLNSGDKGAARRELKVLAGLGDRYPQQDEVRTLLAGL